ncbi:MAG: DUF362 domain-containing protein [Candidatus Aminicenantes bacterium]|nr:MAG: DUF362 domain-containing protein [Candidatus Aminicenantes bacterium]
MKRRDFIKNLAAGGLFLKLQPTLFVQKKSFPDLAWIQGESPSLLTKEAISSLGGIEHFISRGDLVMVKPNIGWDRTPKQAACTNPQVIKTVVELCLNAGAKEVKVMDNPCNQARRTYARSGIATAAKEAGAKVLFPTPHRLKKMALDGEWLKEWEVYTDFVEADKIINVPIAKTHSLSKLSLGVKNWLGALGGNRNQLHQKLDQAMIDLAAFFKPCLTVMDGWRILIRNGPQGGRLSDTKLHKTVMAGVDYIAVDSASASFFEMTPQDLPYLQIAHQRGLGEPNLERLTIEKRTV